jgi:hypothetical protein
MMIKFLVAEAQDGTRIGSFFASGLRRELGKTSQVLLPASQVSFQQDILKEISTVSSNLTKSGLEINRSLLDPNSTSGHWANN